MCVSTLFVTLPSTTAERPLRPCDDMTMRSQPLSLAAAIGLLVCHLNRVARGYAEHAEASDNHNSTGFSSVDPLAPVGVTL